MKKATPGGITNPERNMRRRLRLTHETVRLLQPEALARALSGCDTTSFATEKQNASAGAC